MKMQTITWDGTNTKEVVDFCLAHSRELCPYISLYRDGKVVAQGVLKDNGEFCPHNPDAPSELPADADQLDIEPTDTMRGSGFRVSKGDIIEAKEDNNCQEIAIRSI